jgi:pimeloyl-ACP methyl ester carboxylesterase
LTETCCQFGDHRQLIGVVSEPATTAQRIGFVLVNAGFVPKHGPFRIYVQLARRLAGAGIVTLRFDLGGIGDSQQGYANVPLKARTTLEIRAAVDHLTERYSLDGIVIGGLCSGAEDAFAYAETDLRVKGVVLIDPFSYRTRGWTWRNMLNRFARRSLRAVHVYEPIAISATVASRARLVHYEYMERSESSRILRALIARSARVHFVYTGRDAFNHRGQLKGMFPELHFAGRVTVDYFPSMDHTQLFGDDRRTLAACITGRILAVPWCPTG